MDIFKKEAFSVEVTPLDPTIIPAREKEWEVRVFPDVVVHVAIGEPAMTEHMPIGEHQPEFIKVPPRQSLSFLGTEKGRVWLTVL